MSGLLDADRLAIMRAQAGATLGQSCALQTVHPATGLRTTTVVVPCRVELPRAAPGADFLADDRSVDIVVGWDADFEGTDLVEVDGATDYRVTTIRPTRTDAILRRLAAIEAREPGGPV